MFGLTTLRILALAVLMTPLLVLGVLWFVLSDEAGATTPHREALLTVTAVGVAGLLLIHLVGYRCRAYREGIPARVAVQRGAKAFTSMAVLRMALAEIPFLVGVVFAFVPEKGGLVSLAVGAGITVLLALLHVLPHRFQVRLVQRSLERRGARVPLLEAYAEEAHGRA